MNWHPVWQLPLAWLAVMVVSDRAWTWTALAVFREPAGDFSFLRTVVRGRRVDVYWRRSTWLFWLPPLRNKAAITLRSVVVAAPGVEITEVLQRHEMRHVWQQYRHATPIGGFIDQLRNLAALEQDAEDHEH